MKQSLRCLLVVLLFMVIVPCKRCKADSNEDIFYYTNETKDDYQGQKTVRISKDAAFLYQWKFKNTNQVKKITFDDDVECIDPCTFLSFPNAEEIILPEYLEDTKAFDLYAIQEIVSRDPTAADENNYEIHILPHLKKITIAENNIHYTVIDNVLYSKDRTNMIWYPEQKQDKVLVMPEFLLQDRGEWYINNAYLEEIQIGKRIINGDFSECNLPSLRRFTVDTDNSKLKSVDGVLYNADMSVLYSYPESKENKTFQVPSTVSSIANTAFIKTKLEHLILPSGLTKSEYKMFYDVASFEINDNEYFSSVDGVLYDKDQTYIEEWPDKKTVTTLKLPKTLNTLEINRVSTACLSQIKELIIPKRLKSIYGMEYLTGLKKISVENGNSSFSVYKGCLYDKKCKKLILIPQKIKSTSISVPKTFEKADYIPDIQVPSVTKIIIEGECYEFPFYLFPNLKSFELKKGNKEMKVEDGVLYSKSKKTLVWYPQAKKDPSFIVPSTVEYIYKGAFYSLKYLKSLKLPKELENQYMTWFTDCYHLKEIKVASGNKNFVSMDGVLFTYDKERMLYYPACKTSSNYTVPNNTKIVDLAIENPYLTSLTLSKNTKTVNDGKIDIRLFKS